MCLFMCMPPEEKCERLGMGFFEKTREGHFGDGNGQTPHRFGVLTFQGTQKICLPYSPTKTLSVKSILR